MENRFLHTVIAATPVLLSPVLLFVIAEGWLDFGGGEKDILLVFPYFIATLIFFISAVVLILKKWPLVRWMKRSAAVSVTLLFILGLTAYFMSWLGIS